MKKSSGPGMGQGMHVSRDAVFLHMLREECLPELTALENGRMSRAGLVSKVRVRVTELLERNAIATNESEAKIKDQREFVVRWIIAKCADELQWIFKNNIPDDDYKYRRKSNPGNITMIREMVEKYFQEAVNRQRDGHAWNWDSQNPISDIWDETWEMDPVNRDKLECLIGSPDTSHIRVMPLGVKDLPAVEKMYESFRLSREEAVRLLLGEIFTTLQTFVFPFEGNEKVEFKTLMQQTAALWARSPKTPEEKREIETFYGFGLRNLITQVWEAVAFLRVAPHQPQVDEESWQRKQAFIKGGASGGKVSFGNERDKRFFESSLQSPDLVEFAIFISKSKTKGAMRRIIKEALEMLLAHGIIGSNTIYSAYVLHSLRFAVVQRLQGCLPGGTIAPETSLYSPSTTMPLGKNILSTTSLAQMQVPALSVTDEYPLSDGEVRPPPEHRVDFEIGDKQSSVCPTWQHHVGVAKSVHTSLGVDMQKVEQMKGRLPTLIASR